MGLEPGTFKLPVLLLKNHDFVMTLHAVEVNY